MRPRPLGQKRARNAIVAIVSALAITGGGCGFVFSEGPPAGYERQLHFDCGESSAPPIVDSVAAGLFAFTTVGVAASGSELRGADKNTLLALYGGMTVLVAASAIYGYNAAAACRAAKAERAADWLRAQAWLR